MGFFKKLFGLEKKEELVLPQEMELIENELTLKVFYHEIQRSESKKIKSIAFLTKGLYALGQKEVLLFLVNKQQKYYEIPQDVTAFCKQLSAFAKNEQYVDNGDLTQFGRKRFLGKQGLLYSDLQPHLGALTESPTLHMLLVSENEVSAAQHFGNLRILSMLGAKYRYYPFPYWSELHRVDLPIEEMAQKSIISQLGKLLRLNLSSIVRTEGVLKLTISKKFEADIPDEAIKPDSPLAILPLLDEQADACLTFPFSQSLQGPEAISAPNSQGEMISGCFLGVFPNQEEYSTRMIEDGFSILLTDEQWAAFWEAFKAKENYEITSEKDLSFKMIWE